MIKVEHVEVFNFEGAIRGLRNPLNSWDKSDSEWRVYTPEYIHLSEAEYIIGENDLNLMKRLYKAGSEHRKYLRQIIVSMDITAPLYWWKEFDTYKVGTVANSCSTMHKIHAKEFEMDDFSHEHLTDETTNAYYETENEHNICIERVSAYSWMIETVAVLNAYRELYLETKDKQYWWQLIQLLPSSYNQRRTITMNYENVITMIKQRSGHKLTEWNNFVEILKELPYIKEITEE